MRTYYVYVAWNADMRPLYVGYTNDIYERMWQHQGSVWYGEMTAASLMRFTSEEEAREVEYHQIQKLRPIHNVIYNPRRRSIAEAMATA